MTPHVGGGPRLPYYPHESCTVVYPSQCRPSHRPPILPGLHPWPINVAGLSLPPPDRSVLPLRSTYTPTSFHPTRTPVHNHEGRGCPVLPLSRTLPYTSSSRQNMCTLDSSTVYWTPLPPGHGYTRPSCTDTQIVETRRRPVFAPSRRYRLPVQSLT